MLALMIAGSLWLLLMVGLVVTITIPACAGCCAPTFCRDRYGDTIDAVLSGVLQCLGCFFFTFAGNDYSASWTGVNGSFTATFDAGPGIWINASVGTITINSYLSTDGTCTGDPTTSTLDARLEIECNQFTEGRSIFFVQVFGGDSGGVNFVIFSATVFIDTASPNDLTIVSCGTTPSSTRAPVIGYNGIITLSA